MRPYLILNGKNSNEINGLIIKNMPNISKPEMRINSEEIDGRDGDVITELGYAAYDKTFEIGLLPCADIDQIIGFFNSEGVVVFSNELDKYYNYKIVKAINFEKLIRFKTATVTMHIQPFKYSLLERKLVFKSGRQLLYFSDFNMEKNGINLSVKNGVFSFYGTSNAVTTFLIHTENISLYFSKYFLYSYCNGSGSQNCKVALINDTPTTGTSFAGSFIPLNDNSTQHLYAEYTSVKSFNYIYFNIPQGKTVNFSVRMKLFEKKDNNIKIINRGNVYALPVIDIFGIGNIVVNLNSRPAFNINMGLEGNITIDSLEMEARKGTVLKNRLVDGNYENFKFQPGLNELEINGMYSFFSIENYSRWV